MSPEKDAQLCTKYPKIFRSSDGSPLAPNSAWGFECDDGWYDLIDTLCACIQREVDNSISAQKFSIDRGDLSPEAAVPEEDLQVAASQVKEKFGGLRFYTYGGNDRIYGMITMAESMSYKICEACGVPGRPNKGGSWILTLCDPCRARHEEARAARFKKETT